MGSLHARRQGRLQGHEHGGNRESYASQTEVWASHPHRRGKNSFEVYLVRAQAVSPHPDGLVSLGIAMRTLRAP